MSMNWELQIYLKIELILYGFAGDVGCCVVIHTVVSQTGMISQGILISKVRLAKQDLNIPRLELVI